LGQTARRPRLTLRQTIRCSRLTLRQTTRDRIPWRQARGGGQLAGARFTLRQTGGGLASGGVRSARIPPWEAGGRVALRQIHRRRSRRQTGRAGLALVQTTRRRGALWQAARTRLPLW